MAGNASSNKKYSDIKSPLAGRVEGPKSVGYANEGGKYHGEMAGKGQKFGHPMQPVPSAIPSIGGTHNDIGELSGFITDGYLDKNGTPYGEAAKFNFLPPGMEITNQEIAEFHDMPLRKLTAESYPGDGWMPAPRDMPE
jgi:hypothetical protein